MLDLIGLAGRTGRQLFLGKPGQGCSSAASDPSLAGGSSGTYQDSGKLARIRDFTDGPGAARTVMASLRS